MKVKYLLLFALVPFLSSCGYNSLVDLDEESDKQWANVEDAYKRRADLIPNLQAIVQGSANFEKETLESVIEARAKATSVTVDPSNATAEQMQEYMSAQSGFSGALSKLLVTVERYPELKSTSAFKDFMTQYESTENRISKARRDYNESVGEYNKYRRGAPQVIYSGLIGFKQKEYFEGDEADEEAPEVDFDFGKKGDE